MPVRQQPVTTRSRGARWYTVVAEGKSASTRLVVRMAKARDNSTASPPQSLFSAKRRKAVPHEFVLDAIASLSPWTRPMFGCLAVYVQEKIVLILRDKPSHAADNGVWLATTEEHHESLRRDFPSMRSIEVLGSKVTRWQVLPSAAPGFEEAALRACELVLAGDPRIGKVPGERRSRKSKSRQAAKPAPQKRRKSRSS